MVQNKSFRIGKYYSVKYNMPWTDHDIKDIRVTSVTTYSEASKFGVDSIYSEFFAAYNMGISTYVSMMNQQPEIYVCEIVKYRDPVEVSTGFVLIPKAIVDFSATEELLECDDLGVTINGLVFFDENAYNRGKFQENLADHLSFSLKEIEEFGDANVSVGVKEVKKLMLLTDYKAYDENRRSSFELAKKAAIYNRSRHNRELKDTVSLRNQIAVTKKELEDNNYLIESHLEQIDIVKGKYEDGVEQIVTMRGKLTQLLTGIENGTLVVGSTEYLSLKSEIERFTNSF